MLPPAETFYRETPHPTRWQGDIVLAPSVVLWSPDRLPPPDHAPPAPAHLGQSIFASSAEGTLSGPGTGVVETLWSPVMIVSHDCELEKDFNERVGELVSSGLGVDEARHDASADPTLDPLVVVAPLLPYSRLPAHRHAGIRSAQRIGYLPLPPLPGAGASEYLVDLGRLATVDFLLLATKLASLSGAATSVLRYKLSEAYASRDLTVIRELEALVGETITAVEALPKGAKKTALCLTLASGDTVHLEIRRPRDDLPPEITREPDAPHP